MDNFTFVPGRIDDDQKTCLSLMLRSVKRRNSFVSFNSESVFASDEILACNQTYKVVSSLRQNHKSMLCVHL